MLETSNYIPSRQGMDLWSGILEPFKGLGSRISDFFSPAAEALGTEEYYEIYIELPGILEKDIQITAEDEILIIKGERIFERKDEGKTYYFSERSYGQFQRSFRLPGDADTEAIDATYTDGLLVIKITKQEKKVTAGRRVQINQ